MRALQIKPELLRVLVEIKNKEFTVAELTRLYMKKPNCLHNGFKPARQFVYRNILRMIDADLMEKLSDVGRWPRYKLTENFEIHVSNLITLDTSIFENQSGSDKSFIKYDNPDKVLIERLSKYRSDMLCAIGEAEEYDELCKEMPELCNDVQLFYNEARERSTLLLGKIKALESLLSLQDR